MGRKKVLICGVTGFIGRNAAEYLARNSNYKIYGVFHSRRPDPAFKKQRIDLIRADLTQERQVDRAVRGMDILIQAAAATSGAKDIVTRPYLHVTDNAVMNSLIFRACHNHKIKQVIFFSCSVMYPSRDRPVAEKDFNYRITGKYFGVGWTKVYLEKMAEFYSRLGTTHYTVIRHSNIYGPHDKYDLEKSHVFGATITKVMTTPLGEKIVIWGDGSEKRDLLYIDDLCDFVSKALTHQRLPFELVNVGSGKSVSVRELVRKILAASGRKLTVEYDRSKPTLPFKLALNCDRAKKIFAWKPKTLLARGIRKTLDWYTRNHASD